MAKPTKRRVPPPSRPAPSLAPRYIRRRGRSDNAPDAPPTELTEPEPDSNRKLMIIFIIFFVVSPAVSILVYRIRYAASSTTQTSAEFYPREPHHAKIDVGYQEILDENSRVSEDVSGRNFGNPVLAYITPWNSKGYDVAKTFNSKFTHLSPVWYELKRVRFPEACGRSRASLLTAFDERVCETAGDSLDGSLCYRLYTGSG